MWLCKEKKEKKKINKHYFLSEIKRAIQKDQMSHIWPASRSLPMTGVETIFAQVVRRGEEYNTRLLHSGRQESSHFCQ